MASTPAPGRTSPEQACTRQVAYWVGESLRLAPDRAFDYQHMGLSGRTYEVVRSLTSRARDEGRTDPTWVTAQAASECARLFRDPGSTRSGSGGWP